MKFSSQNFTERLQLLQKHKHLRHCVGNQVSLEHNFSFNLTFYRLVSDLKGECDSLISHKLEATHTHARTHTHTQIYFFKYWVG